MDNEKPEQYYLRNKKFFLKEYWEGNDGTNILRPNGFKEYPISVYTALCQQINANGKVLDLGCGNGLLLKHLMQYSGYRLIPYGIEFLEPSIEQAKKILHPGYKKNFEAGNMLKYSFAKGPFDFIFFSPHHTHSQHRKEFLKKLRKNCAKKIIFYAHPDVLTVYNHIWVGEFPELKSLNLFRKDYSFVSIGVWLAGKSKK